MERVREDRGDDQGEHDQQEPVIPAALARGHGDRDVAKSRGQHHEAHDEQQASERAPGEAQHPETTDRVRGNPLRGEREAEEAPDQRHPERERDPMPSAVARVEPQRREDRVRGDDPQAHVRVVHADPALGEQHAVHERDHPDHDRDGAAPEQEPREDVHEQRHQDAGDHAGHAPRIGVPPDLDRSDLAAGVEGEQLLPIRGRVLLVLVQHHHRGHVGQGRVGVDRIRVRLDDVDRVRAYRAGRCRHRALDVDHSRGEVVVGTPGPGTGQDVGAVDPRRCVALRDDDRELGAFLGRDGRVQRVVLDVVDTHDPADGAAHVQRLRDRARDELDERDPVGGGDGEPVVAHALGDLADAAHAGPAELQRGGRIDDDDLAVLGIRRAEARPEHRREPLAVPGDVQSVDRAVHAHERSRIDLDGRPSPGGVECPDIDRPDFAGARPDVQRVPRCVVGERDRVGHRKRARELARGEVVGADLTARRDPQAITLDPAGIGSVVAPRLDDRIDHRDVQLALGTDPVLAERHEAQGHRVLREMRVRPLVDVVAEPVAPVLQELGRRPRVVDLVEVHLVRLVEPPHAHRQQADREDDQHPGVQPVQASATLALEQPTPIGPDRGITQARPEPPPGPQRAGVAVSVPHRHDDGVCGHRSGEGGRADRARRGPHRGGRARQRNRRTAW